MKDIPWQKSSFSNETGSCVELAAVGHGVLSLRESEDPDPILTTTPQRLRALLDRVKTGALDPRETG